MSSFLISFHLFKWLLVKCVQSKSVLSLCWCASVCCSDWPSLVLSHSFSSFVCAFWLAYHHLPEQTAEPKTPFSASASLPMVLFSSPILSSSQWTLFPYFVEQLLAVTMLVLHLFTIISTVLPQHQYNHYFFPMSLHPKDIAPKYAQLRPLTISKHFPPLSSPSPSVSHSVECCHAWLTRT